MSNDTETTEDAEKAAIVAELGEAFWSSYGVAAAASHIPERVRSFFLDANASGVLAEKLLEGKLSDHEFLLTLPGVQQLLTHSLAQVAQSIEAKTEERRTMVENDIRYGLELAGSSVLHEMNRLGLLSEEWDAGE